MVHTVLPAFKWPYQPSLDGSKTDKQGQPLRPSECHFFMISNQAAYVAVLANCIRSSCWHSRWSPLGPAPLSVKPPVLSADFATEEVIDWAKVPFHCLYSSVYVIHPCVRSHGLWMCLVARFMALFVQLLMFFLTTWQKTVEIVSKE